MNINPKVSILMAIYNESILELNASLNSILSQTYKNLEIIIVNDNPKRKENVDFFKEIKDERVVLLTNETNFGLVNSLNRALSIANGDLIARMDADDIAMPNRIEKQVAYLIENQLDLIGANICHINENGDVIKDNVLYPEKDKEIKRLLPYAGLIAHPTWLGRKEVFQVLGGYRQISWCEDYDFIVRAKIYGFKFGNIQEVLLKQLIFPIHHTLIFLLLQGQANHLLVVF